MNLLFGGPLDPQVFELRKPNQFLEDGVRKPVRTHLVQMIPIHGPQVRDLGGDDRNPQSFRLADHALRVGPVWNFDQDNLGSSVPHSLHKLPSRSPILWFYESILKLRPQGRTLFP